MRTLVMLTGTIVFPVRLNDETQSAHFTLKTEDGKYHIKTIGLGQYEMMVDLQQDPRPVSLFCLAHASTHRNQISIGQGQFVLSPDQVVIEPIFLVSLYHYEDPAMLQTITAQYVTSTLAGCMRLK